MASAHGDVAVDMLTPFSQARAKRDLWAKSKGSATTLAYLIYKNLKAFLHFSEISSIFEIV